ncbi:MFS transporter [Uliginosibacterium sp. H1]|uniref:MFS transporter n=1 Tax=Uliginosibacterium sp. H1 TaxID=3114757 RepID=UPI002E1898A4|nr:MFS transporter [Uliginosibacterium sp. H1]
MSSSLRSGFGVLRHRSFSFYLSAKLLATLAVQMQSVAIGWQVYAISGDVFDLGLIGLAQFLPFLFLILPAGQVADRHNRRNVIAGCFAIELLCAALLLGFTLLSLQTLWPVFAVLALFGVARAFAMPSQQAIIMNLVPAEDFGQAVALSSSTFHVAVIAGPALGGVLYLAGPGTVYALVAIILLLSLVLMLRIHSKQELRPPTGDAWHELLEGLRFVRTRPVVLGAISLDLFAVLFGGAVALLPAYARDVLHAGPIGLGLLRTAPAVGAALTALALVYWPITRRVGPWMFGGVAVFGLATIVLGSTEHFAIALAALVLTGAGDMVSVYIRHVLVQFETPDEIRGRVSAVSAVFIGASNELGEFESGATAGWFGLRPAIVIGGIATLGVTVLWTRLFPVLRKMDRFPHVQRNEVPATVATAGLPSLAQPSASSA